MSLAIVHTRANIGIEAPLVTVETHISNGMPSLAILDHRLNPLLLKQRKKAGLYHRLGFVLKKDRYSQSFQILQIIH